MSKGVYFKLDQVDNDLMNFIAEKSRNVEHPMNVREICKEFIEFSGLTFTFNSLEQRFYTIRHDIHKMDNFDIETRVRILFATSIPVDINFLNELKKEATVDVDEKGRITSYIANDGSLKLEGDHSISSKRRRCHAERRRRSQIQQLSSNDFKGEEEESDVDGKNKMNESMMRSGRVSKKRSFFDFSNDADDGKHKSSTKKKDKKSTKSIDSTPTTPSVNIPSSSIKMTPGIQKTRPSNEVIYDGPGEPSLPIPLNIKPETIQYPIHPEYRVENKPIPFDQYNDQLQSQHRERLIGDDVEFDNTQFSDNNQINEEVKMEVEDQEVVCDTHFVPVIESTSSDEFLKLLQSLVKTLCSEMLNDLEKQIEKTMATLKNENRKIPIKDIEMSLRTALAMIIKAAKPKGESSGNSKGLMGFLMVLNVFALNNSSLTGVQQKIQEAIKGLSDEDKTVSIENIRLVLGSMLLLAT